MLIKVANFSGIAPRLSAKLLADTQAQEARNVRLASGEIRPLRAPLPIAGTLVSGAKSIYQLKDKWLSWATRVHAVPSPIADDSDYRLYYTGDGAPKKTFYSKATQGSGPYPGANWEPLKVIAPTAALTLASGSGSVPAGTFAYTHTLVRRFGSVGSGVMEESRPGPAALITLASEGGVQISRPAIPSGSDALYWRIWRSTIASDYQMIVELPISTTNYIDVLADPLADVLSTNNFHEPPDDMQGLCAMPNGFMAAFRGNEILFSEPWYPHAWPVGYRQSISGRIVAIAPAGSALIVLTEDYPFILTGSLPESMQAERIEILSPCMSADSVVSDGYSVFYAARDGIAAISSSGAHQLVTRSLFDIEDWRNMAPGSIVALSYFGAYVFFYEDHTGSTATTRAMWLQVQDSPPLAQLDLSGVGSFREYFLGSDHQIYQFDANPASSMSGKWRSKVFTSAAPINLGAVQVDADFGSVTINLYADGVQRASIAVASGKAVRLPAGYKARDFEIEIVANCAVRSVILASSISELRGVA